MIQEAAYYDSRLDVRKSGWMTVACVTERT